MRQHKCLINIHLVWESPSDYDHPVFPLQRTNFSPLLMSPFPNNASGSIVILGS